ncbi:hypothetical protein [Parafrankia sp. BMG5.11]|uniref:hypothetical protein n=1 Tax=Parafrankia sp. BMG5.11 TaxID=222540 RepID=UPI001A9D3261|nr:hypothetical protein [Parafrankia sp. BMG5.11]
MIVRKIALIGLCAALAACGSEPAEVAAPTATASATSMVAPAAQDSATMKAAPEGLPSRIAREVIAASGQTCAAVSSAERGADGTIIATCSGGESYQVYTDAAQGPMAVAR